MKPKCFGKRKSQRKYEKCDVITTCSVQTMANVLSKKQIVCVSRYGEIKP